MNNRIVSGRPRFTLIFSFLLILIATFVALPRTVYTADFNIPSGDVNALIGAINLANNNNEDDTINLEAGTYALLQSIAGSDRGFPHITSNITINGAGADSTIIIRDDTAPEFGIFYINNTGILKIDGLTLRGGSPGGGEGGAIKSLGIVTITNSTITDNHPWDFGGGIDNRGTMTITNSTISNNSTWGAGGISNRFQSTLTMVNCTISGNISYGIYGAGIAAQGTTILINTTVSGNDGTGINGGATLINTIIANNSVNDCGGLTTSNDYNIDSDGTCNLTQPHDLPNTNPIIGPLADNGGPTLTHALLEGSPAIDAGDDLNCPETDQRGVTRPQDGDDDGEAICDIGAYELVPPYIEVEIDIKPGSYPNSINLFSRGVIPVAVLTTEDFDSLTVDADSVWFGPDEAEKKHKQAHVEDVDDDGDLDLLLYFRTQDTGIAPGDTEACLIGETYDGMPLEGCDTIRTVPLL